MLSLNADFSIGLGDILVFISAVFFAVSIIMISRVSGEQDPIVLSIVQIAVTGAMGLTLALFTEPVPPTEIFDSSMILLILYAIFFSSALNTTVQNIAPVSYTHLMLYTTASRLSGD